MTTAHVSTSRRKVTLSLLSCKLIDLEQDKATQENKFVDDRLRRKDQVL
jgi:hypothetical protein